MAVKLSRNRDTIYIEKVRHRKENLTRQSPCTYRYSNGLQNRWNIYITTSLDALINTSTYLCIKFLFNNWKMQTTCKG